MAESYDVVIVGGRCGGSSLATLLAREGVRVAVVERVTFPRDTLSSHIFQAPGINLLRRLGVLEHARAAGAECVRRIDFRQDEFAVRTEMSLRPGDSGALMSVRRFVLDPMLAGAAAEAGADMMMATNVTGLVWRNGDGGRVAGVRVSGGGAERELSARLVVGADGRNSTVGRLVGSRKYHVVPSQRFAYWGFFEGAQTGSVPEFVFHHWEGRVVIGCQSDGGLYQVVIVPDNRFLPAFRADRERAFLEQAGSSEPVAAAISGARLAGKLQGIIRWESFFRQPAGSGWALVGDAGHFKDPTPGQGMTDAFRHAAALAPAIVSGLTGSDADLDLAVAGWARWRDADAFEHHWLSCDLGAAGRSPLVLPEIARRLYDRGQFDAFADIFQHRSKPSQVVTPPRLVGATVALVARPGCDRGAVLREVGGLLRTQARRQRLRRHPAFVDPAAHADAGETEVDREPVLA
jgi:2-polyprenyl-6-methoxyphenol hydroxylase-like FAD-dependent oxidoreductase